MPESGPSKGNFASSPFSRRLTSFDRPPWIAALRYSTTRPGSDLLEPAAVIAPDASPLHTPWARHHASLSSLWTAPEPLYVRAPDADRSLPARAAS